MNYQAKLKNLLNNNLTDIILFGSFVKGGFAKDIDIALLLKEKTDIIIIKNKIKKIIKKPIDIQVITLDSIYLPIWLTLIKEGFSIRQNEFLFNLYKIKTNVLYKFSLKKLNNVQKVQFERGIKKVLETEGVFLTRGVVLVPINLKNAMIDFLKTWDIYYESKEYELLPLLRKESFL